MKKYDKYIIICIALIFVGCKAKNNIVDRNAQIDQDIIIDVEEPSKDIKGTFKFRDVFGEEYEATINTEVPANKFEKEAFCNDGQKLRFTGGDYMLGVDVSHHQGNIDWNKVKADGYDFAILRIGYRGYGQAGTLNVDKMFETYYDEAKAAGFKVGVYFFAQTINENEAREEAEFVLGILKDRQLELPVVYDPENILDDVARTDNITREQFTKNTKAFCKVISENGYEPMIYTNMLWETFQLDLSQLTEYQIWYADYEPVPQTPYAFRCWQYSNSSKVNGIHGDADLDIWILE